MSLSPKKVSEFQRISYTVVDKDDIHYYVKSHSNGFFESFHIQFSDIFLATNILDTAMFCSNTLFISNNNIYTNGTFNLNGNLFVSGNVEVSSNTTTNTLNSDILRTTNFYSYNYTNLSNNCIVTTSNVSLGNTLFIDSNNYRISSNVIIDCGINRVRNVSDPVENLDALNLQYFNNNNFKITGALVNFPSNTQPVGWLTPNGQIVSRTTYANLWLFANSSGYLAASEASKANTQFGPGDGSTTFSLPNINCCGAGNTSPSMKTYIKY